MFAWSLIGLLLLGGLMLTAACGNTAETEETSGAPETEIQRSEDSEPDSGSEEVEAISETDLGTQMEAIDVSMPSDPVKRDGYFENEPPLVLIDGNTYFAVIRAESGDIVVQLFADRTPVTVNNFVYLSLTGFYDGTIFHRVLEDFMAQAGDSNGHR